MHADGAGGSGFFQALVAGQFFAGQAGLALAGGGFGFDLQQFAPGGLQLFVQAAGLLAQLLLLSVLRGLQAGFLLADLLLQRRAAVAAFRHGARGLDDGERLLGAGGVAFGRVQPLDDAGDRGRQRDHALQGHQLARHAGAARVAAQQEKGDDGRCHARRRQREQPRAQRLADSNAAQPGAAVIADDFEVKQHGGNA